MRTTLILWIILLASTLGAVTETEPNNAHDAGGVIWCENGQHNGAFSPAGDVDYWYFYGFPGDIVTISTMGLTTLDTIIEVRKESGVLLASNDDYEGTNQSLVTFATGIDEIYYVLFREKYSQTGSYDFSVAGEFISYNTEPSAPFNFNVSNGATGVDPYLAAINWTWGDGSYVGNWVFMFGTDPLNMAPLNPFPGTIDTRDGSIALPGSLLGGYTYYFSINFNGMLGYPGTMPVYSFSTAQLHLPLPFTENFDLSTIMFSCISAESPWIQASPEEGNPGAMMSIRVPGGSALLVELGTHYLVGSTGAYMTFKHLAWMEPEDDHAYVEYSADGGLNWAVFPASAYMGSGVYDAPSGNNPEGACFDAGSYANWADYQNITSATGYWHTERFDLSPWAGSSSFRVRFRAEYDADETGLGWIVDDFHIDALSLPPPPDTPQDLTINQVGASILLHWSPVSGATRYNVYKSNNPDGTFTPDLSGVFSGTSWTAPLGERRFYKVGAVRE